MSVRERMQWLKFWGHARVGDSRAGDDNGQSGIRRHKVPRNNCKRKE